MGKKRRGRGEGGLEQLASGKWKATRSAGLDSKGKPIRQRKTFATKQMALEWLHTALVTVV